MDCIRLRGHWPAAAVAAVEEIRRRLNKPYISCQSQPLPTTFSVMHFLKFLFGFG